MTEQLVSTYSLGFSPDERRSGEVRRLKVELAPHAAQGRSVEYRRSYRDKTQDEQLAERLISAAYLGSTPNPLGVAVDLGATTPREKKVHRQPVSIVVPEEAVLLVPGASPDISPGVLRSGLFRRIIQVFPSIWEIPRRETREGRVYFVAA